MCIRARLILVLSIVAILSGASPRAAPARPNVVLIVGDDQGWGDFGFMGHPVIRTPHLDRLARESALFPNGYVPTSLCRASLATLLTGLYAHRHKICCNDPPEGVDRSAMLPFLRNAPTVPRLLGEASYASLQTGKFWEGHFSNGGFTHGMTTRGRHGEEGLLIGRQTMQPVYNFIDGQRDRPFFLWYAPMLPHEPHNPPERFLKRYQRDERPPALAKYYAMCEWFDETCGDLLAYLDRKGLRDDTLVIFCVDNGWIQETELPSRTGRGYGPKSKNTPYDGGLRTPVIVRWPGRTKAGRYPDLVSTIDLAPTILRAAGLKPPADMPGFSLLDAAAGERRLPRTAVYGAIYHHTAVDVERPALNVTHRWVREREWKLILAQDPKAVPELYEVARDPTEERNRAADQPDRVRRLTRLLDAWWKPNGSAFR